MVKCGLGAFDLKLFRLDNWLSSTQTWVDLVWPDLDHVNNWSRGRMTDPPPSEQTKQLHKNKNNFLIFLKSSDCLSLSLWVRFLIWLFFLNNYFHVWSCNLFIDLSKVHHQGWLTYWSEEKFGLWCNNFRCKKRKVNS